MDDHPLTFGRESEKKGTVHEERAWTLSTSRIQIKREKIVIPF